MNLVTQYVLKLVYKHINCKMFSEDNTRTPLPEKPPP